jgi:hypothetical protein
LEDRINRSMSLWPSANNTRPGLLQWPHRNHRRLVNRDKYLCTKGKCYVCLSWHDIFLVGKWISGRGSWIYSRLSIITMYVGDLLRPFPVS